MTPANMSLWFLVQDVCVDPGVRVSCMATDAELSVHHLHWIAGSMLVTRDIQEAHDLWRAVLGLPAKAEMLVSPVYWYTRSKKIPQGFEFAYAP